MKKERKKRKIYRIPLTVQVSVFFIFAMLLSMMIIYFSSERYMLKKTTEQGLDDAWGAATSVMVALGSKEGLERQDAEYLKKTRKTFRFICDNLDLEYLYLYRIDEKGNREYLYVAAADDEEDAQISDKFPYGTVTSLPLYPSEEKIMAGEAEEGYEYEANQYGNVCTYIIPVKDDDGNILALVGADYSIESMITDMRRYRSTVMIIMSFRFLISLIVAAMLTRRAVVQPINALSRRMKSFLSDRNTDVVKKDRVIEDEISDIEKSFGEMADDISNYIGEIEKLTTEKIQNVTQLDIARKIQSGIVPENKALGGRGYEMYGFMRPAKEVGGDFYDMFELDDGRICLMVGDISGKSISAALFMMMVRTGLRESIIEGRDVAKTMMRINSELCESNPESMFATVFVGILNTESGELTYANAGHNPPVLVGEKPGFLECDPGIVLGLFDDVEIEKDSIRLDPGSGIIVYTDGVTEAVDAKGEQYGMDRLLEESVMDRNAASGGRTAESLVTSIIESLDEYTKGLEQFDDVTCVSMIYKGQQ